MLRAFFFTITLIVASQTVKAQEPIFLDADAELAQALTKGTSPQKTLDAVMSTFAGDDDFTIIIDGRELIRKNKVPVRLEVTGAWGNYNVECNVSMQFARQNLDDGGYYVSGGLWGGGLEIGYAYRDNAPVPTIANYLEEAPDSGKTAFVSGDMLLGPDCKLGSVQPPEMVEIKRIKELRDAHYACSEALLDLFRAMNLNAPPPWECVNAQALSVQYARDLQLNGRNIEMMQKCAIEVGFSAGDLKNVPRECVDWLESYSEVAESALGLCEMGGQNSGRLTVMDPNPYNFSAQYQFSYQRVDCKTYNVTAHINVKSAKRFTLALAQPQAEECLSVDYMSPAFRLIFNQRTQNNDLNDHIRLQTRRGAAEQSIPIKITQSGPGILDIVPLTNLEPMQRYWIEIRNGEDGLKSLTGVPLSAADTLPTPMPALSIREPDAFTTVTWFRTTPFSDGDPSAGVMSMRGGAYQVVRDAPLLQGRPTATRIWLDWNTQNDPDAIFCGTFEVADAKTGNVLFPPLNKRMRPTDSYSDEERRMAKDTANLFGWKAEGNIEKLQLSVSPQVYWRGPETVVTPPKLMVQHPIWIRARKSPNLRVKYGYLKVVDWEDEASAETLARIRSEMEAGRRLTWQLAPVGHVALELVGGVTPAALGITVPFDLKADTEAEVEALALLLCAADGLADCMNANEMRVSVFEALAEKAAIAFARQHCQAANEVCALWVPPLIGKHSDRTKTATGRGIYMTAYALGETSKFATGTDFEERPKKLSNFINSGVGLAHEIGHSFGLHHTPKRQGSARQNILRYYDRGGRFPDIDGLRMHPSGIDGIFKSTETGNGEHPTMLAPLMYPMLLPTGSQHVLNTHYTLWQDRMFEMAASGQVIEYGNAEQNPSAPMANQTYEQLEGKLTRSNLNLIQQSTHDDAPQSNSLIGFEPDVSEGAVPGLMVQLDMLTTRQASHLLVARAPHMVQAVPRPLPKSGSDKPMLLRLQNNDGSIVEHTLTLSEPTKTAAMRHSVSIFLPGEMDHLANVSLWANQQNAPLWQHDIPTLPAKNTEVRITSAPDGMTSLNWDSPAEGTPFTVFFQPKDGTPARSLGSGADSGTFRFDPTAFGLSGAGYLLLGFDNGLRKRWLERSAQFTTPFNAISVHHEKRAALTVTFNRALDETLPKFALLKNGRPTDLAVRAMANRDQLYLRPDGPLTDCANYTIRAEEPLKDLNGLAQRGVADWPLEISNSDCTATPAFPAAQLQIARGGKVSDLVGEVLIEGNTIILSFPAQVLHLRGVAELPTGTYGLLEASRGDTRRDLLLDFGNVPPSDGQLDITIEDGAIHGKLKVALRGSVISGKFSLPTP